MMAIEVMQRVEMKYLLNKEQTKILQEGLKGHMEVDQYGKTSIASLYYDTPTFQLIRTSEEKPLFKEKMRLRSYGLATEDTPVYLEIKRKAFGVVYKRRVETRVSVAQKFFQGEEDMSKGGQINREITAFRDNYKTLIPTCLIIYDRTAYYEPDGDLRLTIDENPRYRTEDLTLTRSMDGISLLEEGWTIVEIKVQEAIPLWLAEILSRARVSKGSFSKYGEAYRQRLRYSANLPQKEVS